VIDHLISGALYQWFESAYFGAPHIEDRSKEFERGLQMTKEQALELSKKSYDSVIQVQLSNVQQCLSRHQKRTWVVLSGSFILHIKRHDDIISL
jgi:hypothetical protein